MSLRRHNPRRDYSEERVVRALEECGCTVFRISQRGIPDLLCFSPKGKRGRSRCFLVEVKKAANSPLTKDQTNFHQDAWANEWPVYVVWNGDDILPIVNEVTK